MDECLTRKEIEFLFDKDISVEKLKSNNRSFKHMEQCKKCKDRVNDVMSTLCLIDTLTELD